jgi:hypothetical protein
MNLLPLFFSFLVVLVMEGGDGNLVHGMCGKGMISLEINRYKFLCDINIQQKILSGSLRDRHKKLITFFIICFVGLTFIWVCIACVPITRLLYRLCHLINYEKS